jgi:hypothetical protein
MKNSPIPEIKKAVASLTEADINERVEALSKEATEFISGFTAEHPEADDLDKIFQCWTDQQKRSGQPPKYGKP